MLLYGSETQWLEAAEKKLLRQLRTLHYQITNCNEDIIQVTNDTDVVKYYENKWQSHIFGTYLHRTHHEVQEYKPTGRETDVAENAGVPNFKLSLTIINSKRYKVLRHNIDDDYDQAIQ